MESIQDILRGIAQRRLETTTTRDQTNWDDEHNCKTCEDRGFLSYGAPYGDPFFGKIYPCPSCNGKKVPADWFANFRVNPNNARAYNLAKSMAEKPSGWLVIQGPVGTGKTMLATAIASTWAGRSWHPETVAQMLARWQGHLSKGDFDVIFKDSCEAKAAIMDDLGSQQITDWKVPQLGMYIDFRYSRRLATVITTNFSEDEMAAQVGERIADRIFATKDGLVRVVSITGPSQRTGREWL